MGAFRWIGCVLALSLLIAGFSAIAIADDQVAVVFAADKALTRAVTAADRAALVKLLDSDFTWIFPDGVLQARQEVLDGLRTGKRLTLAAASEDAGAQVVERAYGNVVLIQVHSGKAHALHIWVRRADGWRALHFNEILQGRETPPAGGGGAVPSEAGVETPCVNPCKTVPFRPIPAGERAALESWQQIETGSVERDMDLWGRHVADECDILDSGGDGILSKSQRIANTLEAKRNGSRTNEAPPLLSARMYDFGNTVVFVAEEQPYRGKPFYATRVLVNRDGRYQMAVSYHTAIADVPSFTLQTQLPNR
jgi:hypothetical protein